MAYVAREIIKDNQLAEYVEANSGEAISKLCGISWLDEAMLIDIVATDVTVGTAISAKLQDSSGLNNLGVQDWHDVATVSITADGVFTIDAAGASRKVRPLCRVIILLGAGDECTITSIRVCGS
jgi:hypothetical protein